MAFFAQAEPAARTAALEPARSARSAYEIVLPGFTLVLLLFYVCFTFVLP